ncbi:beta-ketoacyl-ACP synthase II [uncultured Sneathiella sp.]|jgi:3-oxoacyl-[acyl-carrier-protein] synthase II|uniref:beta-ketoacyl-ACP synthase II n=1 Tax=uncultured Sneathiella sp. TaxID=879315 RepID=UPI0030D7AEDE|tara:strand:+ start:1495 stop:2751 length:1257 start_codon:yes stop_codon:yes gene_type:complete
MRRVVVTGLGLVTPLANGVQPTWKKLINGESGAGMLTKIDTTDLPVRYGCEVPIDPDQPDSFIADNVLEPKEQRKVDSFIIFGIAAADEAIKDSGWQPETEEEFCRTGVTIGSGIGGLPSIEANAITLHERGPRRIGPFFIPGALINLVSGQVSIRHGYKGPNHAVVTACSTGAHAIGDAARMISDDDADVMVAGGAEGAICRLGISGFASAKALSHSYHDAPETASRPYDKGRDGFVMGEGAGVVVLEEYEHAKKRGAKIYAEVLGYGLSGDAYHITAPSPDGGGGYRAMQMALKKSGLNADDIGYVNAHGTSTMADFLEVGAVERLFGSSVKNVAMSSTKSAIGHLLGAAGGVEAIFSILAMNEGILPPTINLHEPAEDCEINLVPLKAQEKKVDAVLSNSFGFGGTNACLVMKRV